MPPRSQICRLVFFLVLMAACLTVLSTFLFISLETLDTEEQKTAMKMVYGTIFLIGALLYPMFISMMYYKYIADVQELERLRQRHALRAMSPEARMCIAKHLVAAVKEYSIAVGAKDVVEKTSEAPLLTV